MDPNERKKSASTFVKYSAISFQMIATIGLFAFAGYKIDEYRGAKTPIFTAILSIVGVGSSLYQVVKQLNKNND